MCENSLIDLGWSHPEGKQLEILEQSIIIPNSHIVFLGVQICQSGGGELLWSLREELMHKV